MLTILHGSHNEAQGGLITPYQFYNDINIWIVEYVIHVGGKYVRIYLHPSVGYDIQIHDSLQHHLPAADYEEVRLDLNQHLIKNPPATFFVPASGDSMVGAGIHNGDLLVVDRSLTPKDRNVVIAVINGQLTVKRIRIRHKKICLEPENQNYPVRDIGPDEEFQVWGVVTNVIHSL